MNSSQDKKVPFLPRHLLAPVWATLITTVLVGCAGQVSPSGGPPDTVPPAIVRTVPDTNSVRVKTNGVELEFSKYVDRRSVEESIFISPYVGELEFDWSGKSVNVMFPQPLRDNTTYVVSVGTDVIDIRASNRMASGFTLAFSTGDSIDRGSVSGKVYDEKPEGVMIFAYTLRNINPDTLDPGKLKPDYVTQTGKDGLFTLSNVALGPYRLFAIRDEYRNLLYEKETDQYGVANSDIVLTEQQQRFTDLWFRLSKEDTTRPFLTSAIAMDRRHILVRFSEPIDSVSFPRALISIRDTLTGGVLPVHTSYLDRSNPTAAGVVTRSVLDSGSTYMIHLTGVVDRAGNAIDTLHASFIFPGTSRPDTVKPSLRIQSLVDSARGVPPDQLPEMHFSEPVEHAPLENAITLVEGASSKVGIALRWFDATDVELAPTLPLKGDTWYQVRVIMDSVKDFDRNGYRDSTFILHFQTLDLRTTGTVAGSVVDVGKEVQNGRIFVTASSIDIQPPRSKTVTLRAPGNFEMEHVPEGRYVVNGFIDADSSGKYTYGLPYPFHASERFSAYPDTIKVRARWAVEGVVVTFR